MNHFVFETFSFDRARLYLLMRGAHDIVSRTWIRRRNSVRNFVTGGVARGFESRAVHVVQAFQRTL